MLTTALTWLGGIHFTSFLKHLPNLFSTLVITLIFTLFYLFKKNRYTRFLLTFFLGFTWAICNAKINLNWDLPKNLENKTILAVGYIASVPEKTDQKTKFYFKLIQLAGDPANAMIQLTWHRQIPITLHPGEKKQLLIKLKRPHSLLNPGGFDQEKFYFKEKIRALGYVIKSSQNKNLDGYYLSQLPNLFRQWLYEKISPFVSSDNLMGIIIALCLGIRNYITPEQWNIFQATGTSHLVAISGLHIGLASGFFYFLTQWIWRRFTVLIHTLPVQQAAALGGLIGGFLYSLLAGFSIPTQRALIMISVLMLATLYRRNSGPWHAFSLALLLSLSIDPLASLSESFWLSFGAVFFIFYITTYRISFGKNLWDRMGKIQWAVTLGLIPITFLFFQQTSLVSFPANLIAIPWVSFLVIPLALFGMLLIPISEYLARWIFLLSNQMLEWIFIFLKYLSQKSYALWHAGILEHWHFGMFCAGIFLLLSPKGLPGRWLGILTFFPLCLYPKPLMPEETIGLTLLDVGQGLSAIIKTRHHILIFDTGAKFSERFDMGKAVVIPYLRHKGIQKIDTLIISHKDNDHMGGAQSILKEFPVQQVITSVPKFFPKNRTEICYRGQQWKWDGVEFRILFPLWGTPYIGNNSSCTLEIKTGNQVILITGDLEKSGEEELLTLSGKHLSSTLLIAGHHGSLTSSTWPFIRQTNPKYVLFSAGYLNQYRFPHPRVVERYQRQGSFMENTAESGALYFEVDQNGITQKIRYRELLKKYWHHPT